MSIKQSESRSGLKSKLASRNLEFEDSELEEALKNIIILIYSMGLKAFFFQKLILKLLIK